jgi:hypothetical protein
LTGGVEPMGGFLARVGVGRPLVDAAAAKAQALGPLAFALARP